MCGGERMSGRGGRSERGADQHLGEEALAALLARLDDTVYGVDVLEANTLAHEKATMHDKRAPVDNGAAWKVVEAGHEGMVDGRGILVLDLEAGRREVTRRAGSVEARVTEGTPAPRE